MIGLTDEYEKMFQVERKLWWYRQLHERVADVLIRRFGNRRDIRILDAGCGTGGLLSYLHERGYTSLTGIDGSPDAVAFCHERNLNVSLMNLNDLAGQPAANLYDAVICNDVFCYIAPAGLPSLLIQLARRLEPGGMFISNNNAFDVFRGQHDLAVGSERRFVRADLEPLFPGAGLRLGQSTYWSLVLSVPILLVRLWQRLQLRLGRTPDAAQSDVYLPTHWVNETLYHVARVENRLLPRTPFGSSLFLTGERITG
ncbi:class I SAM-dependent DNA methyltransferase [Spirosoma rhododendri]|uniref:Methyltransferase domain-containing protein n=1 Tax=Spirosoma rhododendri TaxID=2728024 RepID=A0A7L5DTS6_9BACT|nr:class I SAM-dependent methyltransferase [Spirosoma rhododendri]QJD79377.1 methyltransferase domain-containing protein [Spirosoma rhododendri]